MFSYLNGGLAADHLGSAGVARQKQAYDVTTVTEDIGNLKGWDTITEVHSDAGDLLSRTMEMDSGATQVEEFTGGVRTLHSITDTDANDRSWESRTTEWDAAGVKTQRTTIADNGVKTVEAYDAVTGLRTSRVETDDDNAYSWSSRTTLWDDSGTVKIGGQWVHDGGRMTESVIDAATGTLAQRTVTDGGDKKSWHTRVEVFDTATGQKDERTTTYDNGNTLYVDFVDGKRDSSTITDVIDSVNWTTRTETFDSGQVTSRSFVYDDNSELSHTFDGDTRTSTTRVDGDADQFEWHERVRHFDENGNTIRRVDTMDDGDVIDITYDGAGNLIDQTTYDFSGNETWHVERVFYDASGSVTGVDYFDEFGNMI